MISERLHAFQRAYGEQRFEVDGRTWWVRRTHARGPALVMRPRVQGTADLFYETVLQLDGCIDVTTVTTPGVADAGRVAGALAQLLDRLGLSSTHLLGSSLGGYIAQRFALLHPSRVQTLFLGNTFCDLRQHQAASPSPEAVAAIRPRRT